MPSAWKRNVVRSLFAAIVVLAPVCVMAQQARPLTSERPELEDPRLKQRRDIRALVSQIREDLLVNHDPQAAKEKCERVLAIDPENADALFYLGRAKRLLKGEATTGTRSPVSALPSPELIEEVRKGRPTAPTELLTSDDAESEAGSRAGPARRAPAFGGKILRWAIYGLLGLIAVLAALMAFDRLMAGKRQRVTQAELFERMRAAATASQEAVPDQNLEPPSLEDFPVGPAEGSDELDFPDLPSAPAEPASEGVAEEPASAPAAQQPVGEVDEEIDYWEDRGKPGGPSAASAFATVDPSKHGFGDEDVDVISADKVFGEDDLDLESAPSSQQGAPATAETFGGGARDDLHRSASADDRDFSAPAASAPSSRPAAADEDGEPIPLEGLEVEAPAFAGGDDSEEEAGEKRTLRPDSGFLDELQIEGTATAAEAESDSVPFSLDESFDASAGASQTTPGEFADESGDLESIDAPLASDAPASSRFDEDHPITEQDGQSRGPDLAETLDRTDAETPLGKAKPRTLEESGPSDQDLAAPNPDQYQDEILIAKGRGSLDQTAPLAGQEVGSESTMIDSQARHKAVFQDQLARGQAAVEKGHWKDAVKYLSVAHAMDPTNDYARRKLQEARQKRDQELGGARG